MIRAAAAALILVATVAPPAQARPAAVTLLDDVDFPVGIDFSSDGKVMYLSERDGAIRVVRDNELQSDPLAEILTTTTGETGLLDIAVSPDDRWVYAFATVRNGTTNSVYRVSTADGEVEEIVSGLPANVYHNGGGVDFDREGSLLVSNGETHDSGRSQDPDALGGKIYRFTPDGEDAPDNPFGAAIALGLRNPFGLTVDPVSGAAFVTDNGPTEEDEVDRIDSGGNYGWPDVVGPAPEGFEPSGPGEYHDPVSHHPDIVVPTGIAVADPRNARPDVAGDLFYGTYGEGTIHRIELDPDRQRALSDEVFFDVGEPVIGMAWGPSGLYFSTPDSLRLLPLARRRPGEPPGPVAPIQPAGDRDYVPMLLVAAAVIVVGVALVVAGRRTRRGPGEPGPR
ncbi:MAG TPA: PQQ-dependent sugar dehydrogenase [Actinomycetota bacterium]|nr:PQQ-dependent sugar dehydrogenase [Actinomycetota bacterium]